VPPFGRGCGGELSLRNEALSPPRIKGQGCSEVQKNETSATARYVFQSNSHLFRIPRRIIEAMKLQSGDYVAIEVVGDRIICRRISREYVIGNGDVDARKLMRREGETDGTR
jgi:hypothetical protein